MKVELKNIRKSFGAVHANDGVTLYADPGTLHGLLGENGAGKSTLMKVLSGFLSPDSGEILLDGRPVSFASPAQAVKLGVGMLHQDPLDLPTLSVLDNFLLGSRGRWRLDRSGIRRQLMGLLSQFDFQFDPEALVSDLSIGERQQLEIARLLWLGVRVLILDEPTTAISAQQREKLFSALRKLTEQGKTVLFVSHKLEEVISLCSEVTVLSRGKVTGEAFMPCPTDVLVQMMFGRAVTRRKRSNVDPGKPILEFDHVTLSDWRLEVKDFSLKISEREVVSLAGLEGSGQHLVLRAGGGLLPPEAGRVVKANPSTCVEELSGGNQQRTLLALIPPHPRLVLMEHPTRGLDVESTESIWRVLLDWTRSGTAIVFASSDLDELLDRSDRIWIFFGGRVRTLDARHTTVEQLGEAIGGKGFE
jgi:ABC-type uncharacterized transport system ATPase subunit